MADQKPVAPLQYGIVDILQIVFGRSPKQIATLKGNLPSTKDVRPSSRLETLENGMAQTYMGSVDLQYDRTTKYRDYDRMDLQSTEIQTGLDIYAEEASQPDNKKGVRAWVEAPDPTLAGELMQMFNRVKLEQKSYGIYRNIAKYGDCFLYTLLGAYGVHDTQYVHPSRIDRVQEDGLLGFKSPQLAGLLAQDNRLGLFKPWDFNHFRIIAYDQESTYGRSMVESLRKAWKQFAMLETMVVLFRIGKAVQRNIFYVDVGQASVDETQLLIKEYEKFLKNKNQFIDSKTGEFRMDFNPATILQDIVWPIRPGSQTKVDHLENNPNIGPLQDLEIWRNKIRTGLNIPKDFFDGEITGAWNSREALMLQDARFGRKITRMQDAFREGLTRLCQIHWAITHRLYLGPETYQVMLGTVSDSAERQREDILLRKAQIMEILAGLSVTMGWNRRVWGNYLLDEVYPLPAELRAKLLTPDPIDMENLEKEIILNTAAGGQISKHKKSKSERKVTANEIKSGFRAFNFGETANSDALGIAQELTEEFRAAVSDNRMSAFIARLESSLTKEIKEQAVLKQTQMSMSEAEIAEVIKMADSYKRQSNYGTLTEQAWKEFRGDGSYNPDEE